MSESELEVFRNEYRALGEKVEHHELDCTCVDCLRFLKLGDDLNRAQHPKVGDVVEYESDYGELIRAPVIKVRGRMVTLDFGRYQMVAHLSPLMRVIPPGGK